MHSNEVSFFRLEHVPLFKHGFDEHGLVSLWQDKPVLNWLHLQMYFSCERTQTPWLEQSAKHADKSPLYVSNKSFNWLPAWLGLNKEDGLNEVEAKLIFGVVDDDDDDNELVNELEVSIEVDT